MAQLTLTIAEVCDILNKEIKTNTVCVGVDGATKHTGLCILRTTKDKFYVEDFYGIEMKGICKNNLHTKLIEYFQKFKDFRAELPDYDKKYDRKVIIEDCFFGLNVWTLKVLAKYATISFFTMFKWTHNIPEPIQPVSVRAKVGFSADTGAFHFEQVMIKGKKKRKKIWDRKPINLKQQIIDFIDKKFNLEITDDNLSDAFMLALSGLIEKE